MFKCCLSIKIIYYLEFHLGKSCKKNCKNYRKNDVRITYRGNNSKKRKFKQAARVTSHYKEQLINEKNERKTTSNLWDIALNDKTYFSLKWVWKLICHFKKLVIYSLNVV